MSRGKYYDRLFGEGFTEFVEVFSSVANEIITNIEQDIKEGNVGVSSSGGNGARKPIVTSKELSDELVVRAELPGYKQGEVEVEISDDMVLRIEARQDHETEDWAKKNRSYSYKAQIQVAIDKENAEGSMKDGVLTLRLPKRIAKSEKWTVPIK